MPLVIAGATSGATTLQSTDGATQTITLPNNTGTVITTASTFAGTGPAFSAYQSSIQTLSSNVLTKIQLQTEEFDTANCFDNVTNYRFTPNVAGYYQFNATLAVNATVCTLTPHLSKNGSIVKTGNQTTASGIASANAIIYCNGTTDYVEFYASATVGQGLAAYSNYTYFQAALVRAA